MMKRVKLKTICKTTSGGTPSRDKQEFWENGSIPWIKSGQLKDSNIYQAEEFITSLGLKASSTKLIPAGTLLLALYGATAGKLGFLEIEATINQAVCALLPNPILLSNRYLYYYLLSIRKKIINDSAGGAQPNISQRYVQEIEIPLPPLRIQQQIADILDKADTLRQKDRELLKQYDALAQAIFIEMFGDPVRNEKGWAIKTIRNIALRISDGPFGSNLKTEHYAETGIRVIRLANIGVNEFHDKGAVYISENHYETVLKKYTCLEGDILIATLGEPNPRACMFPPHLEKAVNKADCVMLRVNRNLCNPLYISHLLNMPSMIEAAQSKLHGQTRTRISMGQVAELLISVPPLTLQKEYAQSIELIQEQQMLFLRTLNQSEMLFQSLLQQAFDGSLMQSAIEDAL